jgi:hypothetical protein
MPKSRRLQRYKDFQKFSDESKDLFNGIAAVDSRNEFFGGEYSLCITPGGAYGGRDKRRVEIFYGLRPFDANDKTLLTERGARLDYYLNDAGAVVCSLIPARTESLSQKEDTILFDWVSEPSELMLLASSHWNYFMSYMRVTSLDGDPTWLDQLRVSWLRLWHSMIVSGKQQKSLISVLGWEIFKYTATVGLSGFLLFGIARYFDGPPTAKLNNEIVQLRDKQMQLQKEFGQALGMNQILQSQVTSLNNRLEVAEKLMPNRNNKRPGALK